MLSSSDQQALLAWYDAHQRDLPWRATRDPWAILLSEVLLQQTQVSRGLVYWQRMLAEFPTLASMANAPVEAVLKAWEGAGYYSRARRLHALAKQVMLPGSDGGFDGELPCTYNALLTLPGIGPYTAAAVASIAFGQSVACVDGNIRRVMARTTANPSPSPAEVQAWADASLEHKRPGDWNQALMELGATVCTPKRVKCTDCPLRQTCRGQDTPDAFPRPASPKVKALELTAVVAHDVNGLPMLAQRPMTGMFAGLWGPTYLDGHVDVEGCTEVGTVRHALSHRKITVRVLLQTETADGVGTQPSSVAMSNMDSKVLEVARPQEPGG